MLTLPKTTNINIIEIASFPQSMNIGTHENKRVHSIKKRYDVIAKETTLFKRLQMTQNNREINSMPSFDKKLTGIYGSIFL